jgi:hypothetical protein
MALDMNRKSFGDGVTGHDSEFRIKRRERRFGTEV